VDIFLWGYVKNIVYQVKINDLQHLKARVRDAVTMVTPNMLQAWIFIVPPGEPTLKFAEKVIYAEKNLIVSFCNGVNYIIIIIIINIVTWMAQQGVGGRVNYVDSRGDVTYPRSFHQYTTLGKHSPCGDVTRDNAMVTTQH
jgi:hypothetical protein